MSAEVLPYTERKNSLSQNLSDVNVEEMVQIVVTCHQQIFTENLRPAYALASFVGQFDSFCSKAAEFLKTGKKPAIVLGGCGTSGRLCFLTALNQSLQFPATNVDVIYSVAGGDEVLFKTVEFVEDDAVEGRARLEKLSAEYDRIVYIGISVGLWAPYVAGQLDFALRNQDKFLPVALGFNPPHLARNAPIKGLDRTFREIVLEMERLGHFLITPVIMPEALSGSSRMKGGLATLAILDMIFCCLNSKLCSDYKPVDLDKMLHSFASILDYSSLVDSRFSSFLKFIADKMREGGSLHIVADDVFGFLAVFDCSEAEPTFNAKPGEISAHMNASLMDSQVSWLADKLFQSKSKAAPNQESQLLNALRENDVLFDGKQQPTDKDIFLKLAVNGPSTTLTLAVSTDSGQSVEFALNSDGQLYEFDRLKDFYVQFLAKFVLQTVSTVVFCQLGKVYKNIMIDVKTSNSKLLYRAIRNVKETTGCEVELARQAIVAAVKQLDSLDLVTNVSDDEIIKESVAMTQIVPCAIVMVITGCSSAEAFKMVRGRGRICEVVNQLLSSSK